MSNTELVWCIGDLVEIDFSDPKGDLVTFRVANRRRWFIGPYAICEAEHGPHKGTSPALRTRRREG